MAVSHLVAPSMLSADFANLRADIDMVNQSRADWFHLDIMDGVFVPNISYGIPVVSAIKKHATKPLDVHLMIVHPDKYIEPFRDAGADILTVHYEADHHLHRTLSHIRKCGMKAGIAINPHTTVEVLFDIAAEADMILVMSVNPGFGGQKFIPGSLDKIKRLKKFLVGQKLETLIETDGGVDNITGPELVKAGTDVLVAGNFIFRATSPTQAIEMLKQ